MLTPASATQVFLEEFSLTISVEVPGGEAGEGEEPLPPTPSTEVPVVTRSFEDPGVTVTASAGQVTIAGKYTTILPTTWKWLDLNGNQVVDTEPPAEGQYSKLFQMDAPPTLTKDCVYSIGGEDFTHTVTIVTYDTLRDKMLDLVAKAV